MPTPVYTVQYLGEDITTEISPFLSSITFTDMIEGESDSLSLMLENRDRRWLNEWLPDEGDAISISLGYENEALLGPVTFEIDTVRFRVPPDTVEIKGLATPRSKALREKKARAFENTTLKAIAQAIADEYGFELVGEIPGISFERVTQEV